MSYDTNSAAVPGTSASENFIDLDDLDFAALEVEVTEDVAGGFRPTDLCTITGRCATAGCNGQQY
ncbi:hypothetical protein ACFWD1_09345 [Micromonospora chalcea]